MSIKYTIGIVMKQAKWTYQEENKLKQLKEEQNCKNEVNWEVISSKLNECFGTGKSSKQCRERYVNYLKFGDNQTIDFAWGDEQIDMIIKLYLEHGSAWSMISSQFKNKSENLVKNKFNNSLRKCAKSLQVAETTLANSTKKSVTVELLTVMLDMSNKVVKMVAEGTCKINKDCMIFKFRSKILDFTFKPHEFSNEDTLDLLKLIKNINVKLRCFGVFKVKNRKHWKLTQKCLESFCNYENFIVCKQPESSLMKEDSLQVIDMEKQGQRSSLLMSPTQTQTKFFWQDNQFLQLPCIQQFKAAQKRITLDQELFDIIGYEEPLSEDVNLLQFGF